MERRFKLIQIQFQPGNKVPLPPPFPFPSHQCSQVYKLGFSSQLLISFCIAYFLWDFLKGPKQEIFYYRVFTQTIPVLIVAGDLGTRPKNSKNFWLGPYFLIFIGDIFAM
jgi:hypothetical protein